MKGSCLCESVEFEVDGNEFNIYQCHCSLCKKQSGTTSNSATIVSDAQFRFLKGSELISSWVKESGFRSDFCSKCGSPVPNPLRGLGLYWVPFGLLPVDVEAKVVAHLCVNTASSWHTLDANVESFETLPDLQKLKGMLASGD